MEYASLTKIKHLSFVSVPGGVPDYRRGSRTPEGVFGWRSSTRDWSKALNLGSPLTRKWGKGGGERWQSAVKTFVAKHLDTPLWWFEDRVVGDITLYEKMAVPCTQCAKELRLSLPGWEAYARMRDPYSAHIACSQSCREKWAARMALKGVGIRNSPYISYTVDHPQILSTPVGGSIWTNGVVCLQALKPEDLGLLVP